MWDKFVQDANNCRQILSHRMQSDGPRTESGPHVYLIWSMLFFSLNYLPIWKGRRIHIKLWSSFFSPWEKRLKTKAMATLGLQSQMWQQLAGVEVQIPITAYFPTIVPALPIFTLRLKIASVCHSSSRIVFFLRVCLSHLFILSVWALYTTTVLNYPTDVVRFPSFWLRVRAQVFWFVALLLWFQINWLIVVVSPKPLYTCGHWRGGSGLSQRTGWVKESVISVTVDIDRVSQLTAS